MPKNQPIIPDELTAAYDNEVRLLTLEVLDELGLIYTMDECQIEKYQKIIYRLLAINGIPELYKENPSIFDERIFKKICQSVENINYLIED